MAGIAVIIALAATLAFLPALIDRWAMRRGASGESLAALAAVTLTGLAAVPVTFAICTGTLAAHGHRGHALSAAAVVGLLIVALMTGRALARIVRIRRAVTALASVSSALQPSPDAADVTVLPVDELLAFVAGRNAFVSQGLLNRLTPEQRRAVIEHERAHAQRRHSTLRGVAAAIQHSAFDLLPARRAAGALDRELDVIADRAAAHRIGSSLAIAEALRAVGAHSSDACADEPDNKLRARLERLKHPGARRGPIDGIVRVAALLLGAAVLVSICLAIHTDAAWLGLAACALVIIGFASLLAPAFYTRQAPSASNATRRRALTRRRRSAQAHRNAARR